MQPIPETKMQADAEQSEGGDGDMFAWKHDYLTEEFTQKDFTAYATNYFRSVSFCLRPPAFSLRVLGFKRSPRNESNKVIGLFNLRRLHDLLDSIVSSERGDRRHQKFRQRGL
jgi:hypothetical protein